MSMTITTIWIPKEILVKAKANKLNLSKLLKLAVIDELQSLGVKVNEFADHQLVLKVKCPYCSNTQPTISISRVRCFRCERTFTIYPKIKGRLARSRIIGIIKGTQEMLDKRYYKKFKGEKRDLK
jgi:ribosomal protein S27E